MILEPQGLSEAELSESIRIVDDAVAGSVARPV
jgi:hypothetical protein